MNNLEHNGFFVLISSDYDDIITTIVKYSMGIRYMVKATKRKFRSVEARNKYLNNKCKYNYIDEHRNKNKQ